MEAKVHTGKAWKTDSSVEGSHQRVDGRWLIAPIVSKPSASGQEVPASAPG